jgi:hypothetical protein
MTKFSSERFLAWSVLVCAGLAVGSVGCKAAPNNNNTGGAGGMLSSFPTGNGMSSQLPTTGSGGGSSIVSSGSGGVAAGTGGVAAGTAGVAAGTGGVAAGTGGVGTGGVGTGGVGTGGMGTGGMGTGGMGAAGSSGGTPCDMCVNSMCSTKSTAVKGDTKAAAMFTCAQTKMCSDTCCLCGAKCDSLGSNYAMGPCHDEVETAAGVMPGAGALTNGAMVMSACAPTASPATACSKVASLAQCISMKCASMCTIPACM